MHEGSIFASHYVINDILMTIERGDLEDVRRICDKYVSRYKSDDELFQICNRILFEKEISQDVVEEISSGLKALSSIRRLEGSGGSNIWFSDRRKADGDR